MADTGLDQSSLLFFMISSILNAFIDTEYKQLFDQTPV